MLLVFLFIGIWKCGDVKSYLFWRRRISHRFGFLFNLERDIQGHFDQI